MERVNRQRTIRVVRGMKDKDTNSWSSMYKMDKVKAKKKIFITNIKLKVLILERCR